MKRIDASHGGPFGGDPVRARALKRFFIAAPASLVCVLVVGLWPASDGAERGRFVWVASYAITGHLLCLALLWRGASRRWREPNGAFAQVVFTVSVLIFGCWAEPAARNVGTQLLLLAVAFDLQRLSPRQIVVTITVGALGLGAVSLWEAVASGADWPTSSELMVAVMTVFYVPSLLVVGSAVRRIEARQRRQRADLAAALAQLTVLAERDALTGAFNRRHGQAVLEAEAARQDRTLGSLSIGMLDIDFFKRINDTHGHAVGDAVLMAFVRLAREQLGDTYPIARWGGEEFLVVMPDLPSEEAEACMRRLRAGIASHDWSDCAPGLKVDLSIGLCEHRPAEPLDATLERADAALYTAKRLGRGRVEAHLG